MTVYEKSFADDKTKKPRDQRDVLNGQITLTKLALAGK